ncbi:uncharacterized protein TNCV_3866781 [Trichonephila clavipes]|nr:uncharacterized protein TNCV_3866781 [Trichonephila clavipes]
MRNVRKKLIEWCMKEGLIALNYECSKCNERMGLYERKSAVLDGDFEWVCSTITSQNIYGRTPMILLTMRPSRLFVKIRCHAVASTRKRSAPFSANNRIVIAQRTHLDEFLHGTIINRPECGRTQLEVSEELEIVQSLISRLWQRFQADDSNHETANLSGRHSGTAYTLGLGAMGSYLVFMDDNDHPQRANIVNECFQSEDITLMDWPAFSQDWNPR